MILNFQLNTASKFTSGKYHTFDRNKISFKNQLLDISHQ